MAAIRSTSSTSGLVVRATRDTGPPAHWGVAHHTVSGAPSTEWSDGWPRVLPLQAVGRGRRSARLLDDNRGGADGRPAGRFEGRVGAAARDCRRSRRSAHLCLPQIDHVLAGVLLLLRAAEAEAPRGLHLSRPDAARAAGKTGR